jgi:hypothetical protein
MLLHHPASVWPQACFPPAFPIISGVTGKPHNSSMPLLRFPDRCCRVSVSESRTQFAALENAGTIDSPQLIPNVES